MPLAALDPAAVAKNPACFNVIYPVKPDSTFNMDYYLKTHMPCESHSSTNLLINDPKSHHKEFKLSL